MSLHAYAVATLREWCAPSTDQDRLRRRYLSHLAANRDGMWRACAPSHLTASALVLDAPRRRTLLVLHRRLGAWVQPGGHCEPGDRTLIDVARREAVEETGLTTLELEPRPALLRRTGAPCDTPARWHLDVQYVGIAPTESVPTVSDEARAVRWFAVDDLPSDLASGVADSVATATRARVS